MWYVRYINTHSFTFIHSKLVEQVKKCSTDFDVSEDLSGDEDVLTFLGGLQTYKGRAVRVVRSQMWTVKCVTATSLTFEKYETTGKYMLLSLAYTGTHCSKNCKKRSVTSSVCEDLCSQRHSVLNYCKFSILVREKQLFHVYAIKKAWWSTRQFCSSIWVNSKIKCWIVRNLWQVYSKSRERTTAYVDPCTWNYIWKERNNSTTWI